MTSAVVVFSNKLHADSALQAAKKGATLEFPVRSNSEDAKSCGLRQQVQKHKSQYPGNSELLQKLNIWMEGFEQQESDREKAAQAAAANEGWTVVTRKPGRKKRSGNLESGGVSLAAAQAHADSKKPKLNENFYRFQARELRKNELVDLQKNFSAAKKNLEAMRDARRFKNV